MDAKQFLRRGWGCNKTGVGRLDIRAGRRRCSARALWGLARPAGWFGCPGGSADRSDFFLANLDRFTLAGVSLATHGTIASADAAGPALANSLSGFSGETVECGFRDFGVRALFVRLSGWAPPRMCCFADLPDLRTDSVQLVITFPCGAGYGLPTCYFIIQGIGVLCERSRIGKRAGCGGGVAADFRE